MSEYTVSKPAGRCAVSGRELRPGEMFFSALFETPEGFERRDYAPEGWSGPPEGAFCTFRTRIAEKPARRNLLIDDDLLLQFFTRLGEPDDALKRSFRFVLTLILMRKRLVKYERTIRDGLDERWQVRCVRDNSVHRVLNPRLDEAQVAAVTAELGTILAGSVGEEPEAMVESGDGGP